MRICIVSNLFAPHVRGGYEMLCESIAEKLVELGHSVVVLTSEAIGHQQRTAPNQTLDIQRIFEPVFEYEEHLNERNCHNPVWQRRRKQAFGGVIVSNALALSRFLEVHQPDVVWIFNPLGLGPIGIFEAALTCASKCLIYLGDSIDGVIARHSEDTHYQARVRRLKRNISAISCSRKILIENSQLGQYQSHRIIFCPANFDPVPDGTVAVRTGRVRFVYFGQVEEVKGVGHIISAAGCLRRTHPQLDFEVTIIGTGSDAFRGKLLEQIEREKLQTRVQLPGLLPRSEILARLKDFDAAVMLLSGREPFALAPVEAAAQGLPVVITTGPGNLEAFPRDYPLLVPAREDAAQVASLLEWCIMHRAELPAIGAWLRETLKKGCDFNTVVMPSYLRVLRTCQPNPGRFNVSDLIASDMTASTYAANR